MVFFDIINGFILLLWHTLGYLPSVTVLPFGMTDALIQGTNYFYSFLDVFWPLQIVWTCVLWYLGFRFAMILLRVFIGDRSPD